MYAFLRRIVTVFTAMLVAPVALYAQATVTGTVRDPSGGVLPGVTVEASSPALIEKARTAVTDGSGQYRIIELTAGTYALTFTLPGFSTVRRAGIELSGTQTITIPIEMRVGSVEETITVTGETPVVDVQSVKQQVLLKGEVIATIPATRAVGALLNLTPGLTVNNAGLAAAPTMTTFTARGGRLGEGRMTVNGMAVEAAFNPGVASFVYDSVNAEEVSVNIGGGLGESDMGGPVMNIVPRAGGNEFHGQTFYNTAGAWSRGNNLDDKLRAVGILDPPGIIKMYDGNVSYGGPIRRDRLWFYGSYRKLDTATAVQGIVANANVLNASRWDWVADPGVSSRLLEGRTLYTGRLTYQASAKHRLSFNDEYQRRCDGTPLLVGTPGCHTRDSADWIGLGSAARAPESSALISNGYIDSGYHITQGLWNAPMSNRLFLEAGLSRFSYNPLWGKVPSDGRNDLIPVTEQSATINPATGQQFAPFANFTYRGFDRWLWAIANQYVWRSSASYVTGSHSMKIGYQGVYYNHNRIQFTNDEEMAYRFNQGVPNQVTYWLPDWSTNDHTQTAGLFAQDSWTRNRLTVQGALRYDRAWSVAPAEKNGASRTSPFNAASISFEQTIGVHAYNDLTPRVGVAYDLFGNGMTALKFNWGYYVDAAAAGGIYSSNSPAQLTVSAVNRAWTDTNNNKRVDCDLLNPARQTAVDTCGALTGDQLNFGRTGASLAQVSPSLLSGWGVRTGDSQWGLSVQQQLLPRVSLQASYNRRSFHGTTVTDNTLIGPQDYDAWTIIAPQDSRLPGGGGYPITLYTQTAAAAARGAQNVQMREQDFGAVRRAYWQGVDLGVNARTSSGLTIQAGTSTGRRYENSCATTPNLDTTANGVTKDVRTCLDVAPFQTTLRGLVSYTLPKVDVAVSATLRSEPPLPMTATWQVPNTVVQALLGRLPPGAVASGNTTVQLLDTNDHRLYADTRQTQIDMRFAKILRFGGRHADLSVDVVNLLNTNYATQFGTTYQYSPGNTLGGGTWANPTAVYTPRYARLNFGFTF